MSEDTISLFFDCENEKLADELHTELEGKASEMVDDLRYSQCENRGDQIIVVLGCSFDHAMVQDLLNTILEKNLSNSYAELYYDTAGEKEFLAIRNGSLKEFKRRPPRKQKSPDTKSSEQVKSLSVTEFPQVESEIWQAQRREDWEKIYWGTYDEQPKYRWQHYKEYFFTGDLDKYIKGELQYLKRIGLDENMRIIDFSKAILYTPANTLNQLENLIQHVAQWYEVNNDSLEAGFLNIKKNLFIESFSHFSSIPEHGFCPNLAHEAFFWVYGDTYSAKRTFPIPLGETKWQPILGSHDVLFGLLVQSFYEYFFKKNFKDLSIEKRRMKYQDDRYLDFLLTLLQCIDVEFFDLKLFDRDHITSSGVEMGVQQYMLRALFMGLYGYNVPLFSGTDEFYCRDQELCGRLKEKVRLLDMPDEFFTFINFIKEYKGEAFKYTE